jgi:hypothetical protein
MRNWALINNRAGRMVVQMSDGTLLDAESELLIQAENDRCVVGRESCVALEGRFIRQMQCAYDTVTGTADGCRDNSLYLFCSGCACGHQYSPTAMNVNSFPLYVRAYQSQNHVLEVSLCCSDSLPRNCSVSRQGLVTVIG